MNDKPPTKEENDAFMKQMGILNNTGNHAAPITYVETKAAPLDSNIAALSFVFVGYEPGGAAVDALTALCDLLSMDRENVIKRLAKLKDRPELYGCLKRARLTGRAAQIALAGMRIAA